MSARRIVLIGFLLVLGASPRTVLAQERPAGAQPEEPTTRITLERALIEGGGLLLQPGQFEIEPSVEYTFFSTRRISVSGFSILPTLIIGVLETEKVERNVVDAGLTARLGLFKDFQVDARVPYRYSWDRLTTETAEQTESSYGLGDVEVGVYYQPVRERGAVPDLILGVRGKSRTGDDPFGSDPNEPPLGTGFYSVTGIVTAVKAVDPAAIFGSILYTHNFGRSVRLLPDDEFKTEIDPGGSAGYNLGLALGLTPELGMNFRFEHRFVFPTEVKSEAPGSTTQEVRGSRLNVAIAYLGVTWAVTRRAAVDLSVGIGVTDDAPDVVVRFAIPLRYGLW